MKAAWYEQSGASSVLATGEIADPVAGPGEVVVKIFAHGVNPTDWKRRVGQRGALPFPKIIPGYDAAGIIESVGAGVDRERIGQRVWVWEAAHQKWNGAAAEKTVVSASRAMPLPPHMSDAEGAALGVPAMTACHALMLAGDLRNQNVLVTGAAGAVCNLAVQLAKSMGAHVIGVVRGSEDKEEDAKKAGADLVLNSDRHDLLKEVMAFTDGRGLRSMIDVDLGAHLDYSWRMMAQNGVIASFGTASNPKPALDWAAFMYRNIHLCGVAIFEVPEDVKRQVASYVQSCVEANALWLRIDETYTLDEIARAHDRQQFGRPRGKVIVQP